MNDAVCSQIRVAKVIIVNVASVATGARAGVGGSQSFGAGQRGRGAASPVGELEVLEHLAFGGSLHAAGEVPESVARAQREDEDENMDQQAVPGEDGGPDTSTID